MKISNLRIFIESYICKGYKKEVQQTPVTILHRENTVDTGKFKEFLTNK